MQLLPMKEPKLPFVRKVNIVIKALDQTTFSTLTGYTNQMLLDLQKDDILNKVIGRDVIEIIRVFKFNKTSGRMELTGSNIGAFNIVPKELYMYTMILPHNHYSMLRHIEGRWFRDLAYFLIMIPMHIFLTYSLLIFLTNPKEL
uniref:Uncharacterized protein n=1 Tax=Rhizophagus irregularis (strain DAOM 181602 / DAOM 197198 / MUCL 43194) TaxID=747089 RepID=U9T1U0_RHIID